LGNACQESDSFQKQNYFVNTVHRQQNSGSEGTPTEGLEIPRLLKTSLAIAIKIVGKLLLVLKVLFKLKKHSLLIHVIDPSKPQCEKSQNEVKTYRDVLTNEGYKHTREFFR